MKLLSSRCQPVILALELVAFADKPCESSETPATSSDLAAKLPGTGKSRDPFPRLQAHRDITHSPTAERTERHWHCIVEHRPSTARRATRVAYAAGCIRPFPPCATT